MLTRWAVARYAVLAAVCLIAALALIFRHKMMNDGVVERWFQEELSVEAQTETAGWNESEKDSRLYRMSKWGALSPQQFRSFVSHQIEGLHLSQDSPFFFLEVGMGVGAFTRVILQTFPQSHGVGFDMLPGAVNVASRVLPNARMVVLEGNMLSLTRLFPRSYFDNVFIPGSICYLASMREVETVVRASAAILKPGGGMCLSMIASDTSDTGTCRTRIPKSFFLVTLRPGLRVVQMDEMDSWNTSHQFGRYSVCLRKSSRI